MKKFFSIVINHDYHRVDSASIDGTSDLVIVPDVSSNEFIKTNRLLFRNQNGTFDCFIEQEDELKREVGSLYFWVVCKNEEFYNYTSFPEDINFSTPYYYWTNEVDRTVLSQYKYSDLHIALPPKQTIGCIGVVINEIDSYENVSFAIDFKTRKSFWEFHIVPQQVNNKIHYTIFDSHFEQNLDTKKWVFSETTESSPAEIIFRSEDPIAFSKKATARLKLVLEQESNIRQEISLPYPNFQYTTIDKDNKQLTLIYIHL